jgi:hypothetical protein
VSLADDLRRYASDAMQVVRIQAGRLETLAEEIELLEDELALARIELGERGNGG